jgi:hypothetical protein
MFDFDVSNVAKPFRQFHRFFRRVAGKCRGILDHFEGAAGKSLSVRNWNRAPRMARISADLVGVARGDEQRRHARRLTNIFPLASLTRNISTAKSADEITPVICRLSLLHRPSSRRRHECDCHHERTDRAIHPHAACASHTAHQRPGLLRRAARLAVPLHNSGDRRQADEIFGDEPAARLEDWIQKLAASPVN